MECPAPVVVIGPETVERPRRITVQGGEWVPIFSVGFPVANWTVTNTSGVDVVLAYDAKTQCQPNQFPPDSIRLDPFGEESRDEDTRTLYAWVPDGQVAHLVAVVQYQWNALATSRTGQRGF